MIEKGDAMIDVEMVKAAAIPSKAITAVDQSWREHVKRLKDSIVRLPFPGEYTAIIGTTYTLIEGYSGPLLVDRVADGRTTYLLKKPLRVEDYHVYAYYTKTGRFQGFVTRPVVGFHYVELNSDGDRKLCTGSLDYTAPTTIEAVHETCQCIIDSLRVIYLGSLGTVLVPYGYKGLKKAAKTKNPTILMQRGYTKPLLEPEPREEPF